jgi:Rrf2 family protein
MRLSQTAEYALRVLAYMATSTVNSPLRTRDLYEVTEIPPHYLSKIMRRLVTAGLLASQKGHGGGFVFAKPLKEIRFLDILTAVDYEVEPNKCFFGWGECSGENPCPLHTFWSELQNNFVEWAETHTLKDIKSNT